VGQSLITSDRDIVDNAAIHKNVRLGIRGHLNASEGFSQPRSKSALEHTPGAGLEGRMIARIQMRELRARQTCLRPLRILALPEVPEQKCI
jgi:hypothetical protein